LVACGATNKTYVVVCGTTTKTYLAVCGTTKKTCGVDVLEASTLA
jgi:hypothetical protein